MAKSKKRRRRFAAIAREKGAQRGFAPRDKPNVRSDTLPQTTTPQTETGRDSRVLEVAGADSKVDRVEIAKQKTPAPTPGFSFQSIR
jgi:hypothetical protein